MPNDTITIRLKVAIYCRVSTDKQELDNQLIQLREYCHKQNYEIFKEYSEIMSGAKEDRPLFKAMFEDAHKKKFDIVLFWDLSRFSRSGTLYTLQKLQELDKLNIKWHSYQEPYFSSVGQFKDVILSLMATLAKIEREKISERTKAGLERARKEGKVIGRPKMIKLGFKCRRSNCRNEVSGYNRLCSIHKKEYHARSKRVY